LPARSADEFYRSVSGDASQLAENVSGEILRSVDRSCKPPVRQFVLDDCGSGSPRCQPFGGHMDHVASEGAGVQLDRGRSGRLNSERTIS